MMPGCFERIIIAAFSFIVIIGGIMLLNSYRLKILDERAKIIHFNELAGSYYLDAAGTDFSSYHKDSAKFSRLTLELFRDSTFKMNMSVPFIYDSVGRWCTSGIEIDEMNHLVYKSNKGISTQFSKLYKRGNDSVFFLNAEVGKPGAPFIQEIYFIKK